MVHQNLNKMLETFRKKFLLINIKKMDKFIDCHFACRWSLPQTNRCSGSLFFGIWIDPIPSARWNRILYCFNRDSAYWTQELPSRTNRTAAQSLQKFWYYIIVNFHKIRNILLRAQITLFEYLILLICFINLLIW